MVYFVWFSSLDPDGQTVQSINFYDQAETPGLGGEVVNPNWRALWKGKKFMLKLNNHL